ncbi:Hypothetical predicted protein [Podarcis lilfordi]|uniref:Uncharacterized protein n=1 Tax=Podarcis lilfordi TaxID=74358 RepID=A0AA35L9V4_9SAUR|nr:Hypothetical predicted protein [Podarcis lilfordi]
MAARLCRSRARREPIPPPSLSYQLTRKDLSRERDPLLEKSVKAEVGRPERRLMCWEPAHSLNA